MKAASLLARPRVNGNQADAGLRTYGKEPCAFLTFTNLAGSTLSTEPLATSKSGCDAETRRELPALSSAPPRDTAVTALAPPNLKNRDTISWEPLSEVIGRVRFPAGGKCTPPQLRGGSSDT